ncbi:MAG: LolA family protein [Bacillota bacterium]
MKIRNLLIVPVAAIFMLSGCTGNITASSEEIMSYVLETDNKLETYMGEGELKIFTNDELTEDVSFKEYAGTDGKRKFVSVDKLRDKKSYTLNDGKQVLMYEEGSNQAQSIDLAGIDLPSNLTQKEQLTRMLESLQDHYTYEVVGEEKLLGKNTYHLKVKAKSKNSLLGDMEFWVDQKTWFLVKSNSISGDIRSEVTYTSLDDSPSFDSNTFTIDLPEDVEIKALNTEYPTHSGTLAEAVEALGHPFLVFQDSEEKIDKVEWNIYEGELNRTEVTVYYTEQDIPSSTLSIFEIPKGEGAKIKGNVTVRGMKGEYMEDLRVLTWDEGKLRYSIMIDHPDITKEEIIKKVDKMELSSGRES